MTRRPLNSSSLVEPAKTTEVDKVNDRIYGEYGDDQSTDSVDYATLSERDGGSRLLRELGEGSWVITDGEDLQSQTDSDGRVRTVNAPAGQLLAIGSIVRTAHGRLLTVESMEMRCNGQYIVSMTAAKEE